MINVDSIQDDLTDFSAKNKNTTKNHKVERISSSTGHSIVFRNPRPQTLEYQQTRYGDGKFTGFMAVVC